VGMVNVCGAFLQGETAGTCVTKRCSLAPHVLRCIETGRTFDRLSLDLFIGGGRVLLEVQQLVAQRHRSLNGVGLL
jgi:hypothetical protein